MTVTVEDRNLAVNGRPLLTQVPSNVTVSPATGGSAFLGATSVIPSSRHVFTLGLLEEHKFMCLFRFKVWWMIPRVGESCSEIPMETQMLLLELSKKDSDFADENSATEKDAFYVLLLPLLDSNFKASLQGSPSNELQFCVESGDAYVQTTQVLEAVFVNSGDNPFELIQNSIKLLEKHKGSFSHIDNKKLPAHLDWFGWCTWDAFYKDVNPQGIIEGLQSLYEGGCPPKFLIIDDGWQDTVAEFRKEGDQLIEAPPFASRLVDIKENDKFKDLNPFADLSDFVKFIKEKYGLEFVYAWHALVGYWGGVHPASELMKKYNPKITYPIQCPGNTANIRDIAMDELEKWGIGLIDPQHIYDFYDDLHNYLASCGVDGVKVDVQNIIETLGSGYGGRVSITSKYQGALEKSIVKNFKENNLICCMSHSTDNLFSSKVSAVARASEDFMPNEATFQTLHVASVAFNSFFLGEIVVPDWDMFQSKHGAAEFHAAARALGGCAIYVSDKPKMHDFNVLRKLVLPDGFVLRAIHAGRPTRDCLFTDPVMDGKSLLKIWNMNKLSGVVGVFNCQGAGNWPMKQESKVPKSSLITGSVGPTDVEFLKEVVSGCSWTGDFAIYSFYSGSLSRLPKEGRLEVTLETLKCEIFTITPIRVYDNIEFAPIGLVDMYNSGGASKDISRELSHWKVTVRVRGCGRFGAYSNVKPSSCLVNLKEVEDFVYNGENGFLIVDLGEECGLKDVHIWYPNP